MFSRFPLLTLLRRDGTQAGRSGDIDASHARRLLRLLHQMPMLIIQRDAFLNACSIAHIEASGAICSAIQIRIPKSADFPFIKPVNGLAWLAKMNRRHQAMMDSIRVIAAS